MQDRRLLRVPIDPDERSAKLLAQAQARDVKRLPGLGEKVVEVVYTSSLEFVFGSDRFLEPAYAPGGRVQVQDREMVVESSSPANIDGQWTFRYELRDRDGNVNAFYESQIV